MTGGDGSGVRTPPASSGGVSGGAEAVTVGAVVAPRALGGDTAGSSPALDGDTATATREGAATASGGGAASSAALVAAVTTSAPGSTTAGGSCEGRSSTSRFGKAQR